MNNDIPSYWFTLGTDVTLTIGLALPLPSDFPIDEWGFFVAPESLPAGEWQLRFVPDEKPVVTILADTAPRFDRAAYDSLYMEHADIYEAFQAWLDEQ